MNIIDFIPYGKEYAISRAELKKRTGMDDRRIRSMIKSANLLLEPKNEAIISSSGARGYWRTDDLLEMEAYLRESDHRKKIISVNDSPIRRIVCRLRGDDAVPVRAHVRHLHKQKEPDNQIDGQLVLGGG